MTTRSPPRGGSCEAIWASAGPTSANVTETSLCRRYGLDGNSRAASNNASRRSNIQFSYLCPSIRAGCPILTSRLSTLEPALSVVEGVRLHGHIPLGTLAGDQRREPRDSPK